MTSNRLDWDRLPNRHWRAVEALRASGREVIDLTISNPVEAGLAPSASAIARALERADLSSYRPDPRGDADARRAVARTWERHGAVVDPRHLFLTASTSEAYAYLFKLLCDPGDTVLVPAPSYPLFEYLAALEGVRTRTYPLRYDGGWHVDTVALAAAVDDGARAVVLVHPNNPTGSFVRRDELDRIVEACARRGAAIVSDEVFADYALDDRPGRAGSLAAEDRVATFALGGLSKSVALPHVKLGWIAVAGPGPGRDRTCARLDLIADTYLSTGAIAQHAAAALIDLGPATRTEILRRLGRNLARLRERASGSAVGVLDVEGGWSAIVRAPSVRTGEDWAVALAEERGVLVQPGYFYDFDSEAYLVVSLLTPSDPFDAGIEAVLEVVAAAT